MTVTIRVQPYGAQPTRQAHPAHSTMPAMMQARRIFSLLLLPLLLVVFCALPACGAPRVTSHEPVYRPDASYHSYEQYQQALLSHMSRPSSQGVVRAVVSRERTRDGEPLHLLQLANWYKDQPLDTTASASASAPGTGVGTETESSRPFVPPSTPLSPDRKLRVLLSFGEHAREFITVESFLFLLDYLLEGSADARNHCAAVGFDMVIEPAGGVGGAGDERAQRSDGVRLIQSRGYRARWSHWLLDHVELHLVGVTNPDGKMHVERTGEYCWRNTGRNVDLNRNADWQWGKAGSSPDPKHEEYHGESPFSEAETRFLRDMQRRNRYDAYVSVHSGEQQLFVPFVDTESKRVRRRRSSTDAELRLMDAVVSHPHLGGWLHDSGVGYEMNDYSADGTLFDYFAGVEHVPRVFCVELYGGPVHDDCFVMFNPHPSKLKGVLQRMHAFYVRMLNELVAEHYGVHYKDPAEILDQAERQAALQQHQRICEIEQTLYNQRNGERPTDALGHVTEQT